MIWDDLGIHLNLQYVQLIELLVSHREGEKRMWAMLVEEHISVQGRARSVYTTAWLVN